MTRPIAALFCAADGPYAGLEGVDLWDITRDARLYRGPHPVVAHPPCERWSRYWGGGPSAKTPRLLADDGGCFAAALWSVRTFGGVLEHPAHSSAWPWFGLPEPWSCARPDIFGHAWKTAERWPAGVSYAIEVAQRQYGHKARKLTWLYYVGDVPPPPLVRGYGRRGLRLDAGYHSAEERAEAKARGCTRDRGRLTDRERSHTPEAFRDVLIQMARGVRANVAAHSLAGVA